MKNEFTPRVNGGTREEENNGRRKRAGLLCCSSIVAFLGVAIGLFFAEGTEELFEEASVLNTFFGNCSNFADGDVFANEGLTCGECELIAGSCLHFSVCNNTCTEWELSFAAKTFLPKADSCEPIEVPPLDFDGACQDGFYKTIPETTCAPGDSLAEKAAFLDDCFLCSSVDHTYDDCLNVCETERNCAGIVANPLNVDECFAVSKSLLGTCDVESVDSTFCARIEPEYQCFRSQVSFAEANIRCRNLRGTIVPARNEVEVLRLKEACDATRNIDNSVGCWADFADEDFCHFVNDISGDDVLISNCNTPRHFCCEFPTNAPTGIISDAPTTSPSRAPVFVVGPPGEENCDAIDAGSNAVVITNEEEQTAAAAECFASGNTCGCRIGVLIIEGVVLSDRFEELAFTNFADPSEIAQLDFACVILDPTQNFEWVSIPCASSCVNGEFPSTICEIVTNSPTSSPTIFGRTDTPTLNPTNSPTIVAPTLNPTTLPTDAPSENPTNAPTRKPTQFPTLSPTVSPTKNPTASPSFNPTISPTNNPTTSPTGNPTFNPTSNPTNNPTTTPTENPTSSPTNNPTLNPTTSPTINPTNSPTSSPTNNPTTSPTSNPTTNPTRNPTLNPTTSPTINPTTSPSFNPTSNPTISPTRNPTINPTTSPTINPTVSPTANPTTGPTVSPTRNPTSNPTLNPTSSPTSNPTLNPTTSPTNNPTSNPTGNPTVSPTENPTTNPTLNPTGNPTTNPTENPTLNPTTSPTDNPTTSPTDNPTTSPTNNPTTSPTNNPTSSPTQFPTTSPSENPTVSPTDSPTQFPTDSPTSFPTTSPSANPTRDPTTSPSSSPTFSPTTFPTASPNVAGICKFKNGEALWSVFNDGNEVIDFHCSYGQNGKASYAYDVNVYPYCNSGSRNCPLNSFEVKPGKTKFVVAPASAIDFFVLNRECAGHNARKSNFQCTKDQGIAIVPDERCKCEDHLIDFDSFDYPLGVCSSEFFKNWARFHGAIPFIRDASFYNKPDTCASPDGRCLELIGKIRSDNFKYVAHLDKNKILSGLTNFIDYHCTAHFKSAGSRKCGTNSFRTAQEAAAAGCFEFFHGHVNRDNSIQVKFHRKNDDVLSIFTFFNRPSKQPYLDFSVTGDVFDSDQKAYISIFSEGQKLQRFHNAPLEPIGNFFDDISTVCCCVELFDHYVFDSVYHNQGSTGSGTNVPFEKSDPTDIVNKPPLNRFNTDFGTDSSSASSSDIETFLQDQTYSLGLGGNVIYKFESGFYFSIVLFENSILDCVRKGRKDVVCDFSKFDAQEDVMVEVSVDGINFEVIASSVNALNAWQLFDILEDVFDDSDSDSTVEENGRRDVSSSDESDITSGSDLGIASPEGDKAIQDRKDYYSSNSRYQSYCQGSASKNNEVFQVNAVRFVQIGLPTQLSCYKYIRLTDLSIGNKDVDDGFDLHAIKTTHVCCTDADNDDFFIEQQLIADAEYFQRFAVETVVASTSASIVAMIGFGVAAIASVVFVTTLIMMRNVDRERRASVLESHTKPEEEKGALPSGKAKVRFDEPAPRIDIAPKQLNF